MVRRSQVELREGRPQRTKTIDNNLNPNWDETFYMLLDDPDHDLLLLAVHDDDIGDDDPIMGVGVLPLKTAECIRMPRSDIHVTVPLQKSKRLKKVRDARTIVQTLGRMPEEQRTEEQSKNVADAWQTIMEPEPKMNLGEVSLVLRYYPFAAVGEGAESVQAEAMGKEALDGQHGQPQKPMPTDSARNPSASTGPADANLPSRMQTPEGASAGGPLTMSTGADNPRKGPALRRPAREARRPDSDVEEEQEVGHKKAYKGVVRLNADRFQGGASRMKLTSAVKGCLTITLVKCTNLQAPTGQLNPYVVITLNDPERDAPQVQKSEEIINEDDPRWNDKFDFVNVSATSTVVFDVLDDPGIIESFSSLLRLKKPPPNKLGTLRIHVRDVVQNKRLRDTWALQETQQGDISLKLEWIPIVIEDPDPSSPDPLLHGKAPSSLGPNSPPAHTAPGQSDAGQTAPSRASRASERGEGGSSGAVRSEGSYSTKSFIGGIRKRLPGVHSPRDPPTQMAEITDRKTT